ncbi:MAG: formimidoylglutamase [Bdellovibrio sp.]
MGHSFEHLNSRKHDQIASYWIESETCPPLDLLILTIQDDLGVALNGGRIGARFGAEAVINVFQKMIAPHPEIKIKKVVLETIGESLEQRQMSYADQISKILKKYPSKKVIHIGGGHDHIYPLAMAIDNSELMIVNIDPHLDTRTDQLAHSGTPFRQIAKEKKLKLIQWGTHSFANAPANYTKLEKASMQIIDNDLISREPEQSHRSLMQALAEHAGTSILSLDVDAIESSVMTGVSAVNYQGLSTEIVHRVFEEYLRTYKGTAFFGIYEFNPIYDDLSQKGARFIAYLLYQILKA